MFLVNISSLNFCSMYHGFFHQIYWHIKSNHIWLQKGDASLFAPVSQTFLSLKKTPSVRYIHNPKKKLTNNLADKLTDCQLNLCAISKRFRLGFRLQLRRQKVIWEWGCQKIIFCKHINVIPLSLKLEFKKSIFVEFGPFKQLIFYRRRFRHVNKAGA